MAAVGHSFVAKLSSPGRLRTAATGYLLTTPLVAVVGVLFVIPMLFMVFLSVREGEGLTSATNALTLSHLREVLTDSHFLSSMWLTVKISATTALVCLVIGYPIARTMALANKRMRGILTLLVLSPLLISVVVRNFGWYILLLPNGAIDELLMGLHLTSEPLRLLFTQAGVVIGLANAYLPFMVLAIATSLYGVDSALERASAILGASPWATFVKVLFPLSLPGVLSGCVLVFSMSMSSYVTPVLMGGANVHVVPITIYEQIVGNFRWTYGAAVSIVLLGVTYLLTTVISAALEKGPTKEVFR